MKLRSFIKVIEKLAEMPASVAPGGSTMANRLMGGAFHGGAIASLFAPTLSNVILVNKIRQHPSVRNKSLKYGIGSALGGAAVGGAATHAGHQGLSNIVDSMTTKKILAPEIQSLFKRTPRSAVTMAGATAIGSLVSDVVNAHILNRVGNVPNAVLTARDILDKYQRR